MSLLPPRKKRPKLDVPSTSARPRVPVVYFPVRVSPSEFELIQRAVKKGDSRDRLFIPRKECNKFCQQAVMAAVKKELGILDDA